MKITVIGPGAIGCLLAAYLARAGEEVCLLDYRPERAALLQEKGINVETVKGGFHTSIKATANPAETKSAKMFLLCVKAGDTEAAASRLQGVISPQSSFLSLQNGLGNVEKLEELFGEERVFAGVTTHGATLLDVGRVRHAGYGKIWLGPMAEDAPDAAVVQNRRELSAALNRAGLQPLEVEDIQTVLWRKLLANVGINALTAILRVENGELLNLSESRELMDRAVAEAVEIARFKGVDLHTPDEIQRVRDVCRSTATNISSMLQDVRRQRKTEITQINGAVVQQAARHGVAVPVNEVLTALVRGIEAVYTVAPP
jgi:2-dehydropantoate 2-reductase